MEATHRYRERENRDLDLAVLAPADELPLEEAFRVLWSMPEDSSAAARKTINSRD